MFNLFKSKGMKIDTPVDGRIFNLKEVSDPVFSEKMMGDGFAVEPKNGKICAPVKGTIKSVFPTLHALTMEAENGVDILIHIGLDTVELNGEGFSTVVQEGQKINLGDPLIHVDLNFLANKKKENSVMVVFPEMKDKELTVYVGEKQVGEVAAEVR